MKKRICLLVLTFYSCVFQAQENQFTGFQDLVASTCYTVSNWVDRSAFKHEVRLSSDLGQVRVITKSKGLIINKQSEFGNCNLGIRLYTANTHQNEFWEFDKVGGLPQGEHAFLDKNTLCHYTNRDSVLTDC